MKKKIMVLLMAAIFAATAPQQAFAATPAGEISVYTLQAQNWLKVAKAEKKAAKKNGEKTPKFGFIYSEYGEALYMTVGQPGYWVSMYNTEGKAIKLYGEDQWVYGAGGNVGYDILLGNYGPIVSNINSDMAGAVRYYNYYELQDDMLVPVYEEDLYESCVVDTNGNGYYDWEDEITEEYKYYYGSKELTEDEFAQYAIQGDFKTVYGNMKYKKVVKKLKNVIKNEKW